jgi:hypothetical protein
MTGGQVIGRLALGAPLSGRSWVIRRDNLGDGQAPRRARACHVVLPQKNGTRPASGGRTRQSCEIRGSPCGGSLLSNGR